MKPLSGVFYINHCFWPWLHQIAIDHLALKRHMFCILFLKIENGVHYLWCVCMPYIYVLFCCLCSKLSFSLPLPSLYLSFSQTKWAWFSTSFLAFDEARWGPTRLWQHDASHTGWCGSRLAPELPLQVSTCTHLYVTLFLDKTTNSNDQINNHFQYWLIHFKSHILPLILFNQSLLHWIILQNFRGFIKMILEILIRYGCL